MLKEIDEFDNNEVLDFNFWPSFSDLMLSLVLILSVILFAAANFYLGNWDLQKADKSKIKMVKAIAGAYVTEEKLLPAKDSNNQGERYGISTNRDGIYDIEVKNGPAIQEITFGENILFKEDEHKLEPSGKMILKKVAKVIKDNLASLNVVRVGIMEIQIKGHADPRPTRNEKYSSSNLVLASFRAIEVFKFFQNECGIDPTMIKMSATTFGEFMPISRRDDDFNYSKKQLDLDNDNELKQKRNRRIEIRLFYRY